MGERGVRVVTFTSFPDHPAYDDSVADVDPATGLVRYAAWPGVSFDVPSDGYDPTA